MANDRRWMCSIFVPCAAGMIWRHQRWPVRAYPGERTSGVPSASKRCCVEQRDNVSAVGINLLQLRAEIKASWKSGTTQHQVFFFFFFLGGTRMKLTVLNSATGCHQSCFTFGCQIFFIFKVLYLQFQVFVCVCVWGEGVLCNSMLQKIFGI